jgi:hypothetical protein
MNHRKREMMKIKKMCNRLINNLKIVCLLMLKNLLVVSLIIISFCSFSQIHFICNKISLNYLEVSISIFRLKRRQNSLRCPKTDHHEAKRNKNRSK